MNVAEILQAAVKALEDANIPEDLRVPAFESAIRLVAGTDTPVMRAHSPVPAAAGASTRANGPGPDPGARLQKVASQLGVAPESVERLFDEHEGELQYVGDLEALGKAKSSKVQAVAILLVAARQAGGYDEGPTSDTHVRKELDRHGLLDVSNYSKHLVPLKGYLNINGTGRNLNFKLKYEGRQRAKELAQQAMGDHGEAVI